MLTLPRHIPLNALYNVSMGLVLQNTLYDIAPKVRKKIIDSFTPEAFTLFDEEFRFFDKVTSISGVLYALPKDARRAGIRRWESFPCYFISFPDKS